MVFCCPVSRVGLLTMAAGHTSTTAATTTVKTRRAAHLTTNYRPYLRAVSTTQMQVHGRLTLILCCHSQVAVVRAIKFVASVVYHSAISICVTLLVRSDQKHYRFQCRHIVRSKLRSPPRLGSTTNSWPSSSR